MSSVTSMLALILFGIVLGWAGALLFSRPGGRQRVVIAVSTIGAGALFAWLWFGCVAASWELLGTSLGLAACAIMLSILQRSSPK